MGVGWDQSERGCHPDKKGCIIWEWLIACWKIIHQHFFKLITTTWLFDCCIEAMLKTIVNSGGISLKHGDFLRYISLWFLMATCSGCTQSKFWGKAPYNPCSNPCPYQFSVLIHLFPWDHLGASFHQKTLPHIAIFSGRYLRWLLHGTKIWQPFPPSWLICLDESMSIWSQRWTCPRWVFCTCKPHQFGYKYHMACCGLLGVLFSLEMMERKDWPLQLGPPEYDDIGGKRTGLLLCMLSSIFHFSRYVALDRGFCVLQTLIKLKKKGVFAATLMKKQRYWPTLVPGAHTIDYFKGKAVGSIILSLASSMSSNIRFGAWRCQSIVCQSWP